MRLVFTKYGAWTINDISRSVTKAYRPVEKGEREESFPRAPRRLRARRHSKYTPKVHENAPFLNAKFKNFLPRRALGMFSLGPAVALRFPESAYDTNFNGRTLSEMPRSVLGRKKCFYSHKT